MRPPRPLVTLVSRPSFLALVAGALPCALCVSATAHAAGLSIARFGGEHGTPMTSEPTAIYYNPSGIADAAGGHVFGDLNVAFRRATYEHRQSDSDTTPPDGLAGANAGRATLFNVLFEPFVGATYKFDALALGVAYYIPFGGQETWDQNGAFRGNSQAPGAVDGVQRWYNVQGEIRSAFLSAAAAWSFGQLKVGLSANVIQTLVNNVQARNTNGTDSVTSEGRAWLDVSSWDFSMGAGLTYTPTDRWRLGLSYQSRPGFGGGIRATGDLHTYFASASTSKVAFTTDLPDVVRAGAAYRPTEKVELRLFGDYQRWSVLKGQCITAEDSGCPIAADGSAGPNGSVILNYQRDWHDTFGVRGGASYWLTPDVELLAGAGFSSNAVPASTLEPALMDLDAITAAIGTSFSPLPNLRLGATYTQVFYISRDTTGESQHPAYAPPSRSPDSGGKYTLALGLLNVNANFAF